MGEGNLTGLGSPPETLLRLIGKRVAYTAERIGADPKDVLRRYVRGGTPLLSLAGMAAGLPGEDED